jgi:ribosomal-protein-alanine N-acetyltransferase
MPLSLRDFRPEDLEAAYRLDQACFEPGIAYSRDQLRSFLSQRAAVALVAETENGLAGFAIGHRSGSSGHIVTIDVAKADRRRGAARMLLSEMLRRLRSDGVRRVRLEVDLRNAGAIRFYEKMGFRTTRTLTSYYGKDRDGLEMVRELSRSPNPKSKI